MGVTQCLMDEKRENSTHKNEVEIIGLNLKQVVSTNFKLFSGKSFSSGSPDLQSLNTKH